MTLSSALLSYSEKDGEMLPIYLEGHPRFFDDGSCFSTSQHIGTCN